MQSVKNRFRGVFSSVRKAAIGRRGFFITLDVFGNDPARLRTSPCNSFLRMYIITKVKNVIIIDG